MNDAMADNPQFFQLLLGFLFDCIVVYGIFLYKSMMEGYWLCLSVPRMGINHLNKSLKILP